MGRTARAAAAARLAEMQAGDYTVVVVLGGTPLALPVDLEQSVSSGQAARASFPPLTLPTSEL